MTDLTFFDVTIPLVRTNEDGTKDRHDVTVRIPSWSLEKAEDAGVQIGYAIVENLPNQWDENRYGWKLGQEGPTATEAAES